MRSIAFDGTKTAEALHAPVVSLFAPTVDQSEQKEIGECIADPLPQSAQASLGSPANMTTQMGCHHG